MRGGGIQRQTDTSGHGGVEEKDIRALSLTLSLSLCLDDNISVVTYLWSTLSAARTDPEVPIGLCTYRGFLGVMLAKRGSKGLSPGKIKKNLFDLKQF